MGGEAISVRVGRLLHAEDFDRVLRARSHAQGPHFAAHHSPEPPLPRPTQRPGRELSTDPLQNGASVVDSGLNPGVTRLAELADMSCEASLWLGAVVPKRHAKRAVTRNLIKRQIRATMQTRSRSLPPGVWVIRLRAGFDRARFPSAASEPLRQAVRRELDALLNRCVDGRPGSGPAPGGKRWPS